MVECQLPKLDVAGSSPVARSLQVDGVVTSQELLIAASKPRKSAAKKSVSKNSGAKKKSRAVAPAADASASRKIDQRIRDLGDWRGETLERIRALIHSADPKITEEWKWNTPVWSHHGIVCTGEAYKKVVKLTFPRGASVSDPAGLFNSSLKGNTRRAIDIREGEKVPVAVFKALVKTAVARNSQARSQRA